jgi:hypothetical protein
MSDIPALEFAGAPQQTAGEHASPINFAPAREGEEAIPETPDSAAIPASSAAPYSPVTRPFELRIDAGKRTEITVVADKEVVFDGTIKAGENRSFSATDHFQVTAQDAGALQLELNGKPVPPFGAPGQAGKITLTRNALNGTTGGEN